MNVTDKVTAQISLHVIDIVALRKLVLVSYALAGNLGGAAGQEQECLARVLDDVVRTLELAAIKGRIA
jgi:hypothetical protein